MSRKKDTPSEDVLKATTDSETHVTPESPARQKPLVFITHDHRDADLAQAFADLLVDASGGFVKPFRSSDKKGTTGIEYGAEWHTYIMSRIGDATDVVALLTRNSLNRPWILYEAGVAKGKRDTPVFGVAIGISLQEASTGPFAQFQNCGDDEESLTKLVLQLIKQHSDAEPREEAVQRQVNAFRENVAKIMKTQKTQPPSKPPEVDPSAVAKLFEEIKVMFKELPDTLQEQLKESFDLKRIKGRRRRRFHPMMLEMAFHEIVEGRPEDAATAWLMMLGSFQDEIPALYEAGLEVYRALRRGSQRSIAESFDQFRAACASVRRLAEHGPMGSEFLGDDPDTRMFLRHLVDMTEHFAPRISKGPAAPRRKAIRPPEPT